MAKMDDREHAARIFSRLGEFTWVTHEGEIMLAVDMDPRHALAAYKKCVDYANFGWWVGIHGSNAVTLPLLQALRMQALGEVVTKAELEATKAIVRRPPRVLPSELYRAIKAIDDDAATGVGIDQSADPVDYAARLAQLINEERGL